MTDSDEIDAKKGCPNCDLITSKHSKDDCIKNLVQIRMNMRASMAVTRGCAREDLSLRETWIAARDVCIAAKNSTLKDAKAAVIEPGGRLYGADDWLVDAIEESLAAKWQDFIDKP